MEKTVQTSNYGEIKVSGKEVDIVGLITKLRNDLIKDFLDERLLKEYFQSKYHHLPEISKIKLEFIRKDLKELFLSPINMIHYKPLIDEIQTHERTSLTEGNEALFYQEIEAIFRKYFY